MKNEEKKIRIDRVESEEFHVIIPNVAELMVTVQPFGDQPAEEILREAFNAGGEE